MRLQKIIRSKIFWLVLVIILFLFYYYPLQRLGAEIKYLQYTEQQGLPRSIIISKKAMKDYKSDGYSIRVKVKDDDNHEYRYRYHLIKYNKRKGLRIHEMDCVIYDETNRRLNDYSNVLYPPLE